MIQIEVSTEIRSDEVVSKNHSFSPSQYKCVRIANENSVALGELLDRPLSTSDKGVEVGSQRYISNSPFMFVRTKGLQRESFLPSFSSESVVPILPSSFMNCRLQKGDILISKDSNAGEAIILDRDYPRHMISGGIYKLPIKKQKLYVFGLLKSAFFRTQLEFLVSRGATITHAGKRFLDCKIPFPNQDNKEEAVEYVERLVETIIEQEKSVRARSEKINKNIEKELLNQKRRNFHYEYPTDKEIRNETRLDTRKYGPRFREIDFLLRNYAEGFSVINKENIKSGTTPERRKKGADAELEYLWITPTSIADYGVLKERERITCEKNNLGKNAMLLVNRTSRGDQGEYVGIAMFFDAALYGAAQHNQGIYRVEGYSDTDLLFMSCFMNCGSMRLYCAGLTMGSKMKEIKASQFLEIPFPNFPDSFKKRIANMYREIISTHEKTRLMKQKLEFIVDELVSGKRVEIDQSIFKN